MSGPGFTILGRNGECDRSTAGEQHVIAEASEIIAYVQGFDTALDAAPLDPATHLHPGARAAYGRGWQDGLLALIEGVLPSGTPAALVMPRAQPQPVAPHIALPSRARPGAENLLPDSDLMLGHGWGAIGTATAALTTRQGPHDGAAVIGHRLTETTVPPNYLIYGCPIEETISPDSTYVISAWVWIPAAFSGTDIALCAAGFPAPEAQRPDFDRREVWQRIRCPVHFPPPHHSLYAVLSVNAQAGDELYTTAWKVEPGRIPTDYVVAPRAQHLPPPSEPGLGYLFNNAGLNNQKLALLGLFMQARETGQPLRLPDMLEFGNAVASPRRVPFGQVYNLPLLTEFAARHAIRILPGPPTGVVGALDLYVKAILHLDAVQRTAGLQPDDFTADFFRQLVPALRQGPLLPRLLDEVFTQSGIHIVAQFRIEKDWTAFAEAHPQEGPPPGEDALLPFQDIVAKIRASLPDWQNGVYVACDEAGLPADKETMRATALRRHGVELFWKSDFLDQQELQALSALDLSLLDFEIALRAPVFVGLSRSSFSNMVTYARFAETRQSVTSHYIYNLAGPSLARRTDNGAFVAAADAVGPPVAPPP